MKNVQIILLFFVGFLMIISGCAGKNKIGIQEKIKIMSDEELINHYQLIEMRIVDTDRDRECAFEEKKSKFGDAESKDYGLYYISHGSHGLRKEKRLVLNEMKARGISPPRENPYE